MKKDLISEILKNRPVKKDGLKVTLSNIKKRKNLRSIEQAACYYILSHKVKINVSSIIDDVTRAVINNEQQLRGNSKSLASNFNTRNSNPNRASKKREKSIKIILQYETKDYFIKGHIDEINKAYTNGCYTSVFILTRKVIENLIIDILRKKFPPTSADNKELYYSIKQNRYKDFSVILESLRNKKHEFDTGKDKTIDRLYERALKFKDDANDATHSWYHLIETSVEIDNLKIQSLIELIRALET